MAYPSFPQSDQSKESTLTGRELDRASNGRPRIRCFYAADKKEFSIVHEYISNADKATLEAFIAANRYNNFDFLWKGDGITYSCLIADKAPEYTPHSGTRWSAAVYLVQA